jgi:hypothetical protein
MAWPARSPDLNPIEHVWAMIDQRISGISGRGSVDQWQNTRSTQTFIKIILNQCNKQQQSPNNKRLGGRENSKPTLFDELKEELNSTLAIFKKSNQQATNEEVKELEKAAIQKTVDFKTTKKK